MSQMMEHQDIRDGVRVLCETFPPEYHRKIDEKRGYPEAFVEALTNAGWLAAMIPEQYGGSGLGLTEASWEAAKSSHVSSVKRGFVRSRRSPPISSCLTLPSTFSACRGLIDAPT